MDEIYIVKLYNPEADTWSNVCAFADEDDAEDFVATRDGDETYDIEPINFTA